MKYRRLPLIVKAKKWVDQFADHPAVRHWTNHKDRKICKRCGFRHDEHGGIDTRDGLRMVCPGDYIVESMEGEFIAVGPEEFHKHYERIG